MDQAEQGLQQGRLACTVRAYDADDFTLVQGEGGAVEDIDTGQVPGDQIHRIEQGLPIRLADMDLAAIRKLLYRLFFNQVCHRTPSYSMS
jgi:hypothetical protein